MKEENFLMNARKTKRSLGLSTEEYISIFKMSKKEAELVLLNPHQFPLTKAMEFCEHFKLDIVTMFSDHFDVNAFARNYCENAIDLPECYHLDKNSRVVTLMNIVSTLEDHDYGWLNELIFKRLQVPVQIIHFPEMQIPLKLILDYFSLAEQFRVNSELINIAGVKGICALNKTFHFTSDLTSEENNLENTTTFYEDFFENKIQVFDKSFGYKIVSNKDGTLVLKCTPNEELKDLYKWTSISNKALVNYKAGIASGISSLLGLATSATTILATEKNTGYDLLSINMTKQPAFAHGMFQH